MHSKQPRELRERLVRALMETLDDPYDLPRHEPSTAGPAISRRVPCANCAKTGRVGRELRICGACDGTGWRRRRKGDQAWDEYLDAPVADAESQLKPPPRQFKLDEDIRRLWFELQRLERIDEPDDDALDRAMRAKDWLDKRGSYRELRRALDLLERRSACVYGAVWRRYVWNVTQSGSTRFDALVGIGVSFLAVEMRGEIRVPHAHAQAVAVERVKTVEGLAAEGLTAGQIARQLAMPKRKVQHLLTRMVSSDAPGTT